MTPPCYNTATRTDCPRRHAGCQTSCREWKRYLVERDKIYVERQLSCIAYQTRKDAVEKAVRKKYLQRRK